MRVMLEASTGRCKHLWLDASICRHMGRPACLSIRLDAIGDAEAFGLQPTYLPDLMCRTPHGAESLCAFAQFEFAVGDAHRHDVLVAPARAAARGAPRSRLADPLAPAPARVRLLGLRVAPHPGARARAR